MIPQTAYYSHKVTDSNGDVHEIGLSGLIEEGETFADASRQVADMVLAQSQEFVIDFDEEIASLESSINSLDGEIESRLESLGTYTSFAELNGLDFKPPQFPFERIENNEQQGTEAGEATTTSGESDSTPELSQHID